MASSCGSVSTKKETTTDNRPAMQAAMQCDARWRRLFCNKSEGRPSFRSMDSNLDESRVSLQLQSIIYPFVSVPTAHLAWQR
jgi:hypothetical protein